MILPGRSYGSEPPFHHELVFYYHFARMNLAILLPRFIMEQVICHQPIWFELGNLVTCPYYGSRIFIWLILQIYMGSYCLRCCYIYRAFAEDESSNHLHSLFDYLSITVIFWLAAYHMFLVISGSNRDIAYCCYYEMFSLYSGHLPICACVWFSLNLASLACRGLNVLTKIVHPSWTNTISACGTIATSYYYYCWLCWD